MLVRSRWACVWLGALFIALGCGDSKQPSSPAGQADGANPAAVLTGGSSQQPAAPSALPAAPIKIAWQLKPGRQYVYDYQQSMSARMSMGESSLESTVKGRGTFRVIGQEKGGTLELRFEMTEGSAGGQPIPKSSAPPVQASLPMSIQGEISQEGTDAGANMRLLAPLFFPLPGKPLPPGGKVTRPMTLSAPGFPKLVGTATFQGQGGEVVDGRKCVKYHASCELKSQAEQEQPAALSGEVDCVFAFEEGFFVSVKGTARASSSQAGAKLQQTHDFSLDFKALRNE